MWLCQVVSLFCLAASVRLVTSQAQTPFCPLCGQSPQEQDPPAAGSGVAEFRFDICCPFVDNRGPNCVPSPLGEASRVTGLDESLLGSANLEPSEDAQHCLEFFNFKVEESERTSCCESCTCYGDPNCISFDGTNESWILCDGRQLPTSPKRIRSGYCPQRKSSCLAEVDADGLECVWAPDRDGVPSEKWSIAERGSPCQPTKESFINLYTADSFNIEIGQVERGNIFTAKIKLGQKEHVLTADNCVNGEMMDSWTGDPINPDHFHRGVEMYSSKANNDIIWEVLDPDTRISVTIRCTAYAKDLARMSIESVLEPNPDFRAERRPLGGFCATNDLGNRFPSEKTALIQENGYCGGPGPKDNVIIARAVCQDITISKNAVQQCRQKFCNQYWFPHYRSVGKCLSTIKKDWENGFCKAFTKLSSDEKECKDTIREFGWDYAVAKYYARQGPVSTCVDDFADFPDSLDECIPGVELQSFDEEAAEWVPVKGIPDSTPACADEVYRLCSDDYPELFERKIRWIQKRERENCLLDKCARQNGFAVEMSWDLATSPPTAEPPTPLPTTETPTESPTSSQAPTTETPTSEPPTSIPTTEAPTRSPAPEPTPGEEVCNLAEFGLTPFDFANSELVYNNLNGEGPNTAWKFGNTISSRLPLIWYRNVFVKDNRVIDIVLRDVDGSYTPSNKKTNAEDGISNNGKFSGVRGELGQINLKCGTSVLVEFMFIVASCAQANGPNFDPSFDTQCDMLSDFDNLNMRVYDVDYHTEARENVEEVTFCRATGFLPTTLDGTVFQSLPMCNGDRAVRVVATTPGITEDNADVFDPLLEVQRTKLAEVFIAEGTRRFMVNFTVGLPDIESYRPRCGRRIIFSGYHCLTDDEQVPN